MNTNYPPATNLDPTYRRDFPVKESSRHILNDVDDTIVHLCKGIQSTAAGTQGVPETVNALAALVTARGNVKRIF